jgi:hypothetical protein
VGKFACRSFCVRTEQNAAIKHDYRALLNLTEYCERYVCQNERVMMKALFRRRVARRHEAIAKWKTDHQR